MCIDFSEVDDPEIRAAYEKTFPKFLSAKTVEEKNKNWWLLHKLGHWESKENGEDQPANDELQKMVMGIVREVANDKDGEPNV